MRTAIFVDGANLYSSAVTLGWRVDFKRVLEVYGQDLYRAYYFTALPARTVQADIHRLADYLSTNGWSVITKQTKERKNEETGIIRVKGNMDVEIAVYAMRAAMHCSKAVFFTGDGDFRYLIQTMQEMGVHVTVVSSYKCDTPMIANELRTQADKFVDLADPSVRDMLMRRAPQPTLVETMPTPSRQFFVKLRRG